MNRCCVVANERSRGLVQNSFEHVAFLLRIEERIGRPRTGRTGLFIEIQDRIDDHSALSLCVRNDILDTEGALVEKTLDDRMSLQR